MLCMSPTTTKRLKKNPNTSCRTLSVPCFFHSPLVKCGFSGSYCFSLSYSRLFHLLFADVLWFQANYKPTIKWSTACLNPEALSISGYIVLYKIRIVKEMAERMKTLTFALPKTVCVPNECVCVWLFYYFLLLIFYCAMLIWCDDVFHQLVYLTNRHTILMCIEQNAGCDH